jgi:hypothetical protein
MIQRYHKKRVLLGVMHKYRHKTHYEYHFDHPVPNRSCIFEKKKVLFKSAPSSRSCLKTVAATVLEDCFAFLLDGAFPGEFYMHTITKLATL